MLRGHWREGRDGWVRLPNVIVQGFWEISTTFQRPMWLTDDWLFQSAVKTIQNETNPRTAANKNCRNDWRKPGLFFFFGHTAYTLTLFPTPPHNRRTTLPLVLSGHWECRKMRVCLLYCSLYGWGWSYFRFRVNISIWLFYWLIYFYPSYSKNYLWSNTNLWTPAHADRCRPLVEYPCCRVNSYR